MIHEDWMSPPILPRKKKKNEKISREILNQSFFENANRIIKMPIRDEILVGGE